MSVVAMSHSELSRYDTLLRIMRRELRVEDAALLLGLSRRQIARLLIRLRADGPEGLVSRKRGKPSNRRHSDAFSGRVVALVREHYADFGPTLATEYLAERHKITISVACKRIDVNTRVLWNGRSSRVALLVPDRARLMDDGTPMASYALYRPSGRSLILADELDESHWNDCTLDAFEQAWRAEAADLLTRPFTERFYLATGRLLPIWNLLGDEAQVRRLVTQDGRSLLGRIVPADAVNMLLDKLGLGDRIVLSADQMVEAALSGKVVSIDATLGLNLKRSRVNGEQRLEILGFDPRSLPSWKARGCFAEIIAYQTRLFVPVNQAQDIVAKLAA